MGVVDIDCPDCKTRAEQLRCKTCLGTGEIRVWQEPGQPWLQDPDVTLYHGDCLEVLRELPSGSVHMCATSPPFYGLRDYQTDGQIGLEETPDEWVARLVAVFREVRRVLRDDGTLWVEIGDSYIGGAQGGKWTRPDGDWTHRTEDGTHRDNPTPSGWTSRQQRTNVVAQNAKPKDLLGQPWLLAFALRADGWYLRSEIIWARPNPMPESVTDRPTKSHSTVFLLSKSARYSYDADAIREPASPNTHSRGNGTSPKAALEAEQTGRHAGFGAATAGHVTTANARSVWTIPTEPTPFAHFATWPQALVRRMILAGTSEKGCCPECGAPWVRETELSEEYRSRLVQRTRPEPLGDWLRAHRLTAGLSAKALCAEIGAHGAVNHGGAVSNWEKDKNVPTAEQWRELKRVLSFGDEKDAVLNAWHVYEKGVWQDGPEWGVKRAPEAASAGARTVGWSPSCPCGSYEKGRAGSAVAVGDSQPPDNAALLMAPVPCTVLDPFSGSGTTSLVARNHGRHSIGIELNEQYLEIAARRLQQLSLLA